MEKRLTERTIMEIKGLYYYDLPLEATISELDKHEWKSITSSVNSRLYQHYGFSYNYASRRVAEACEPIPECLQGLRTILSEKCKELGLHADFNQCIINNYIPGQGISRHIDHHAYGEVIGCFTLGTGAIISFDKGKLNLYAKPNSLYIMSEDARYVSHEMPARKSDVVDGVKIERGRRVSVTFRYVEAF